VEQELLTLPEHLGSPQVLVGFVLLDWKSFKKSLKIAKGQSESVYRRRTDNTMVNGKSTKG
jgi:hypothetical protein